MKQILLIEDEPAIAELERDYLEIEGFSVQWCADGAQGLEEALDNHYDLIILDLMLPSMDGFQICKRIREHKETPIVMVSARREDIDKVRGLGLGADDYVLKPFSPMELVARVKAHLARFERLVSISAGSAASENGEPRIESGDMTIYIDSHRITIEGQEVALTPREFDILLLLGSYPNKVFTKEELFEKVWGQDSFGETSTIMVHVNRMRDKLTKINPEQNYIDTVWGVGYRFHKHNNYKKL